VCSREKWLCISYTRQALTPNRRPRWLAPIAIEFHQEIGGAVDHARLVTKAGRGVHKADELHHLFDPVEIPQGIFDHGQAIERCIASCFVALFQRDALANHPRVERPPVLCRGGAREIEQVVHGIM